MGRVHPIGRFLGTNYKIGVAGDVVTVGITQPEYAALLVQRYKKDLGSTGPLKVVATPRGPLFPNKVFKA